MKQYVLGVLLLSVLNIGAAGAGGVDKDACLLESSCRWSFGGELSFLRPDGAMVDYATKMVFVTPTIVDARGSYVDTSYEPSWSAFVRYDWPEQHADVLFRTSHFDHDFGSSVVAPNAMLVVNSTLVSEGFFDQAGGNVLFQLDNYELTVGSVIHATQTAWRLRPYTGIHYVDENNRLIQRFNRADGSSFLHLLTNRFQGVGPVIGLESQYPLLSKLSLKNDVTLGFMVGQADMRTVGDINDAPAQPITFVDFQNFNRDRLVPYAFFDIGLLYSMPKFRGCDTGISGGFKIIYYNDIHGRRGASGPNDPLKLNYATYYGPYIGVQLRA